MSSCLNAYYLVMAEDRFNILCLIKGLGLGGAEKLLASALPYLDRSNFDYQIGYFLPRKKAIVPVIEMAGFDVHCFNIKNLSIYTAILKLAKFIQSENVDLIHAHLPYPGIIARLAGRILGTPVVYTEHNVWSRLHPITRYLNRLTFSLNDYSITVSDEVAASMQGIKRQRIQVIENGVDWKILTRTPDETEAVRMEFNIPFSHFLIGNVANLTPKKNHENLIRAFALFSKSYPYATLILVGQPFDRLSVLQKLTDQLEIGTNVRFVGTREDVPRLVRAFDVFVISSDFEGLPVAMLEAMALKKPVIATTVGGIPSVVRNGVEGYLVPPRSPEALAEKMLLFAIDRELAGIMGEAAFQRVKEHYDISQMVKQVEAIYMQVLSNTPINTA